jgi:hypothetical protein
MVDQVPLTLAGSVGSPLAGRRIPTAISSQATARKLNAANIGISAVMTFYGL